MFESWYLDMKELNRLLDKSRKGTNIKRLSHCNQWIKSYLVKNGDSIAVSVPLLGGVPGLLPCTAKYM